MSLGFFETNSQARELYLALLECLRGMPAFFASRQVIENETTRHAFACGCIEFDAPWMTHVRGQIWASYGATGVDALEDMVREICEASHCDIPAWAELPTVVEPNL